MEIVKTGIYDPLITFKFLYVKKYVLINFN